MWKRWYISKGRRLTLTLSTLTSTHLLYVVISDHKESECEVGGMTIERREVRRELHFSFHKALFASGNEVEAFLKHIISGKNEKEPEEREEVWGRMSCCWCSLINNYKTW